MEEAEEAEEGRRWRVSVAYGSAQMGCAVNGSGRWFGVCGLCGCPGGRGGTKEGGGRESESGILHTPLGPFVFCFVDRKIRKEAELHRQLEQKPAPAFHRI